MGDASKWRQLLPCQDASAGGRYSQRYDIIHQRSQALVGDQGQITVKDLFSLDQKILGLELGLLIGEGQEGIGITGLAVSCQVIDCIHEVDPAPQGRSGLLQQVEGQALVFILSVQIFKTLGKDCLQEVTKGLGRFQGPVSSLKTVNPVQELADQPVQIRMAAAGPASWPGKKAGRQTTSKGFFVHCIILG